MGAGDVVAITGASGSGKSTALSLLAMTLRPDSATALTVADGETDIDVMRLWRRRRADEMARLRGRHFGYVLQQGGLIPSLTVRQNILLPHKLSGRGRPERLDWLAEELGLQDILGRRPGRISTGQRQRVAIARALITEPDVIIADEPTASVDPITADRIFGLLIELVGETGAGLVISSHDWERVAGEGFRRFHHRLSRDGESVVSVLEPAG